MYIGKFRNNGTDRKGLVTGKSESWNFGISIQIAKGLVTGKSESWRDITAERAPKTHVSDGEMGRP